MPTLYQNCWPNFLSWLYYVFDWIYKELLLYKKKKSREIWFGIKRSICQSTNKLLSSFFVLVQSLSHVQLFATPWTIAHQASFTISWSLLKLMSVDSVMPSSHLILCCSRLLLSSIFPNIRVFCNKLALRIRSKYCSFSIRPSNEYSGLISFRIDRFDDLAIPPLKSLLQHHSSKASILWHSAFFIYSIVLLME